MANFPPCLQETSIPNPGNEIDTGQLLAFLPKTGTIGKMATFYFTFVFSRPYEPFIPLDGPDADLFFPGGKDDPRNQALVQYRCRVIDFIKSYIGAQQEALAQLEKQVSAAPGELQDDSSEIHQQIHHWPLSIEM